MGMCMYVHMFSVRKRAVVCKGECTCACVASVAGVYLSSFCRLCVFCMRGVAEMVVFSDHKRGKCRQGRDHKRGKCRQGRKRHAESGR